MTVIDIDADLVLYRDRQAFKNEHRVYLAGKYIGRIVESGYARAPWTHDGKTFFTSKRAAARALRDEVAP